MTKILVIEDGQALREAIMTSLQLEGFEAIEAPNGRIGVELAHTYRPDIILCDVMMPELDGYGVLVNLRSEPSTATVPFIFLTAKSERQDMRHGMELGADDYLTKPFHQDELLNAIQSVLRKQSDRRQAYERQMENARLYLTQTLPHELRTPLTSILGFSEFLCMDYAHIEPDQIRTFAEGIHKAGQRLFRLVENYLLYAQLEIMRFDPEHLDNLAAQHTSHPAKVFQFLATHKAENAKRQGDIRLEIEECAIRIPEDILSKIGEELLDNALKFSKQGSPVFIKASVDNTYFHLWVEDAGFGMTPEQIEHVGAYIQFERKLHEQQGTGMGLSIVKGLVELYQGKLTIQSIPNQGTQVYVGLPLR
ncbi:MAG: response regulator [Chloroflexi bacterium]|nr:response regulator [Chloroflexota bacterium]